MCSICDNQRPRFYFVILSGNYYKKTFISPCCSFPFSESVGLKYTPPLSHCIYTFCNSPFLFFLECFVVIAYSSFDAWILTITCKSWKVVYISVVEGGWSSMMIAIINNKDCITKCFYVEVRTRKHYQLR